MRENINKQFKLARKRAAEFDKNKFIPGELVEFIGSGGNPIPSNNTNRVGMYLGERPLPRSDGKFDTGFAVLFPDLSVRVIGKILMYWYEPLKKDKD